jgi:hypothetical protein
LIICGLVLSLNENNLWQFVDLKCGGVGKSFLVVSRSSFQRALSTRFVTLNFSSLFRGGETDRRTQNSNRGGGGGGVAGGGSGGGGGGGGGGTGAGGCSY